MLNSIWDAWQHWRIAGAESKAETASRLAREAGYQTHEHAQRLETLGLLSMAMWSLVQERLGLSEQELADRVRELDLRDGKLDGKLAGEVSSCGSCGRILHRRHRRCIYCGGESLETRPFQGL